MADAGADAGGDGNREIGVVAQIIQVGNVGDVFHQIHLPCLQRHGLGRRVTHVQQFDGSIGHFALPIVLVADNGHANVFGELLCGIGTGADGGRHIVGGMGHIQNDHNRMAQILGQIHHRLRGDDGEGVGSIIHGQHGFLRQEGLGLGGAAHAVPEQPLNAGLHRSSIAGAAVRELNAVPDVEHPLGMVITHGIAVAQPGHHVHGVIETEQALADTIAGAVPGGINLLRRVHTDGVFLNTEGQSAVGGDSVLRLKGLLVDFALPVFSSGTGGGGTASVGASASGHDTGGEGGGQKQRNQFFTVFHSLHLPFAYIVRFRPFLNPHWLCRKADAACNDGYRRWADKENFLSSVRISETRNKQVS